MNTSLVISGYALYLFMGFVMLLILAFIFYGCAYVTKARKCDRAEKKYKDLRSNYNILLGMYQRDTFKVPDVDTLSADTNSSLKFMPEK